MKSHPAQPGFTLIELLVAISITVLLISMIGVLFNATQQAVSTGIKTSEALVESESIRTQLTHTSGANDLGDMDRLLSPVDSEPGFLVIAQKKINDVRMSLPGNRMQRENIRSDQLSFVRARGNGSSRKLHAITPKHDNELGNDLVADRARIWYGHAIRTGADGTVPSSVTLESDQPPNAYGNRWVLARHALLFAPSTLATGSDTHADSARWDADVLNSPTAIGSPKLFHSLTDVTVQTRSGMMSNVTSIGYPSGAYPFAVPDNRPRTNTSPDDNSAATLDDRFVEWRIAQMHTNLANNVSDFVVEFAGDYEAPVGEIDKDGDDIKWYGYWYNNSAVGRRDPTSHGSSISHDPSRPTVFEPPAAFTTAGAPPGNIAYYDETPGRATADAVFTWRHDDSDPSESKWPYLIRIRYRLHDNDGRIRSSKIDSDTNEWSEITGRWFEHVIKVNRP